MDFATFARDYGAMTAALIVGVVGFAGVITAQFVNAYLARRQRRDAIDHERHTLRTALLEELRFLKLSYEDRAKMIKEVEDEHAQFGSFLVPTDTMSDAYQRLVDRIGLLTSEQAATAIQAYLAVRQVPAELRLLEDEPFPDGDMRARHWIRVPRRSAADVRGMHESRVKLIDDAIKALEAGGIARA